VISCCYCCASIMPFDVFLIHSTHGGRRADIPKYISIHKEPSSSTTRPAYYMDLIFSGKREPIDLSGFPGLSAIYRSFPWKQKIIITAFSFGLFPYRNNRCCCWCTAALLWCLKACCWPASHYTKARALSSVWMKGIYYKTAPTRSMFHAA
jgi:hypothetical protein